MDRRAFLRGFIGAALAPIAAKVLISPQPSPSPSPTPTPTPIPNTELVDVRIPDDYSERLQEMMEYSIMHGTAVMKMEWSR